MSWAFKDMPIGSLLTTTQHAALISSVNSLLATTSTPNQTSSNAHITPCILVFFTHHRPHLAAKDMAFLSLLAASGDGWEYEKVVEEWRGVMFDEDKGDEKVRGTVHGWRAWPMRKGEGRGERKKCNG